MKKILSSLAMIVLISACKKTELPVQQEQEMAIESSAKKGGSTSLTVTTNSVYVGSAIAATAYGTVSSSGGGSTVSERGFCYSTSNGPTINDDTARAGSGSGNFQRGLVGLSVATTYYVKAYAIKSGAVYYGNELSFTTLSIGLPSPGIGTVTDIDGNIYNTITYGTQVWMVENLKTTRYRDGTPIQNITDNAEWASATLGAYCNYNNDPSHAAVYGRLYNSYAVKDTRMIAPAGWHVPTYFEWSALVRYLGGTDVAGGRMKEAGLSHWLSPNTAADNSSGFTAVGSGTRSDLNGTFTGLNTQCRMWTSLHFVDNFILTNTSSGYIMSCYTNCSINTKSVGFAIRCIKD